MIDTNGLNLYKPARNGTYVAKHSMGADSGLYAREQVNQWHLTSDTIEQQGNVANTGNSVSFKYNRQAKVWKTMNMECWLHDEEESEA